MSRCELLAGTADGIRRIEVTGDGAARVVAAGLQGEAIRGLAVDPDDPDTVWAAAGLRGWGLHRSRDGGATFEPAGFADYWCWDVSIDPANSSRILVGTEPPMLWESVDAGKTWRSFSGIDSVSSRSCWTFFHPPFHAGHLHGIAISEQRPDRILVGVEHGGLLLSMDAGETWRDVMPGADLHRIEIDPEDPDRIFAGAGNGLFLSLDGGRSWFPVKALHGRYVHGIVIDPGDMRRMYVYIDSRRSPVHRSVDAGETWEPVGTGLPSSRPADPVRLHPANTSTLFYTGDTGEGSTLFISENAGESWNCTELDLPKVWRLEAIAG